MTAAGRGSVQTVLGPIAPEDLGPTLMHEHLLCDIRHPSQRKPDDLGPELALDNVWAINYGTAKGAARNYLLDARDVAIDEVRRMVDAGGRSVVDLSSGGLSPDPMGLVQIARDSGAHVIMGCGQYVHDFQDPANATRTVEDFAEEMVEAVRDGVWGTDVRAGIIGEIGCQAPWTAAGAAGDAGRGARPAGDRRGHQRASRPPSRPAAGGGRLHPREGRADGSRDHQPHRPHRLRHRAAPAAGRRGLRARVGSVRPGVVLLPAADIDMPNDAVRLRAIRRLIDRGHLAQVLISHDICYRSRLVRCGGHGYGHIFANVVPMMRRRGFSEAEIQAILVGNPRRLLTLV